MDYVRHTSQHDTQVTTSDGREYIEGYASVFYRADDPGTEYEIDGYHERFSRSAFDKVIASGSFVEAVYDHCPHDILGNTELGTLRLSVDERGLKYRVPYNPEDPDHQKIKAKLASGLIRGSSFKFRPERHHFSHERGKDICWIDQAWLGEVGPVQNPCYSGSTAVVRSEADQPNAMADSYHAWKETQKRIEKAESLTI